MISMFLMFLIILSFLSLSLSSSSLSSSSLSPSLGLSQLLPSSVFTYPSSHGVLSGIHLPDSSSSWEWYPSGHESCSGKQSPSSFILYPGGHSPSTGSGHEGSDGSNRHG